MGNPAPEVLHLGDDPGLFAPEKASKKQRFVRFFALYSSASFSGLTL